MKGLLRGKIMQDLVADLRAAAAEERRRTSEKTLLGRRPVLPFLATLCWIYLASPASAFDIPKCRLSLGMQSGEIPDHAITSSSSYNPDSVGPENARIRMEDKGGAWCPKQQVAEDVYEWLQIDLGALKIISMVETQGRFGNGQGQEFADQYLLEYQREDEGPWIRFRNRRGREVFSSKRWEEFLRQVSQLQKDRTFIKSDSLINVFSGFLASQYIFQGNTNTYIAELREVDPPIIARKVRFIPYSAHPRAVCLRVELYGCDWEDGAIWYAMHQGERRGTEVDLYDFTYDGKVTDIRLDGGLGQLTDGETGESNFRLDPKGFGIKGYDWVGWRNESHNGRPIEIVFKFDAVRNFSLIRIHANNMFSKDVRVFKKANVYFSIGGQTFTNDPVVFEYMRDTLIEYSRHVEIHIPHRIGKYVKLEMYFDSRWMMISEIQFQSEYAVGNFTPEVLPSTAKPPGASTSDGNVVQVIDLLPNGKPNKTTGSRKIPPSYDDANSLGANRVPPTMSTSGVEGTQQEREKKSLDEEYIGIIIGALAALILLLFLVIIIIIVRQRQKKANSNHQALIKTAIVPRHVTLDLNDLQANGANDATLSRDYAVPDITKSSFGAMRPNIPPPAYSPNLYGQAALQPPGTATHYAAADVVNIPNIQGVSGSNVYAVPNPDLLWTEDLAVMEFPRENLKFIEKLGEGQFGEVHLCEAMNMTDYLGDDFLVNRTASSNSMLVAVKTLRRNADQPARTDFQKEVKIMSTIKDPNIVRVLGVCTRDDPLSVIVEYMKFGDLNQYLVEHVAENTTPKKKHNKQQQLSRGALVYMATQIASGMKYLESMNMVHRDLATRNCLVGNHYCIKISDFGMSRNLYSNDYYRIEGRAVLPIRWMSWESILLGKFSCKSDVWSFGVTIWEILTLAREQPFDDVTDEQVIENAGHYYRNDGLETYLPQPPNCPREIYDLMKECWNREEVQRPTFREIHMFLQRKNMGYDPVQDQGSYSQAINVPVV